jgi:uncharacterized protein (UPF0276 family)
MHSPAATLRPSALPGKAGVGYKPEHFDAISSERQPVGFFEIHAENYMGAGGVPHAQLTWLRERYALSVHGVGLSIGGLDPLDRGHLAALKRLCDRYDPESVSEHLAWSSHGGVFYNDLLPLPYTDQTFAAVVSHVDEMQTALGRRILLENPATYVRFEESAISEIEFLAEVARATGCGLLLDVNNVFVCARNHFADAHAYLAAFPLLETAEIHLAGHFATVDDDGSPLLIDAHGCGVSGAVMALFESVIARTGPLPTLIEWDNDIPDWTLLRGQAEAVQKRLDHASAARAQSAA